MSIGKTAAAFAVPAIGIPLVMHQTDTGEDYLLGSGDDEKLGIVIGKVGAATGAGVALAGAVALSKGKPSAGAYVATGAALSIGSMVGTHVGWHQFGG